MGDDTKVLKIFEEVGKGRDNDLIAQFDKAVIETRNKESIFEEIKNNCSSFGEARRLADNLSKKSKEEQKTFIVRLQNNK